MRRRIIPKKSSWRPFIKMKLVFFVFFLAYRDAPKYENVLKVICSDMIATPKYFVIAILRASSPKSSIKGRRAWKQERTPAACLYEVLWLYKGSLSALPKLPRPVTWQISDIKKTGPCLWLVFQKEIQTPAPHLWESARVWTCVG